MDFYGGVMSDMRHGSSDPLGCYWKESQPPQVETRHVRTADRSLLGSGSGVLL